MGQVLQCLTILVFTMTCTDEEFSERLQKRELYQMRDSLAEDVRTQRTVARVIQAEQKRLAEEAAALHHSVSICRMVFRHAWCGVFSHA